MTYYQLYEFNHAAMGPARVAADMTRLCFQNPLNPLTHTDYGRSIAAACELFERSTRRYGKPEFGLTSTLVGGERVPVTEKVVWEKPFCRLVHFERGPTAKKRQDPKVLVVAPMSGHYATLLRGTVEALLPRHEVYITDWADARTVPVIDGRFDLEDYVDYVIEMNRALGGDVHVMAVCQPAVPVLIASAVMNAANDPAAPLTMVLMGGPIDTRHNPTAVNELARSKSLAWFERNVIMKVPFPHAGVLRDVYPGFLQLTGFMSMNLDRHLGAHKDFFNHLVSGDGDSATKHREFYDEYLAVMDLTAEFYLQTVEEVFMRHALAKGEFRHRGERVDCAAITRTALLTIEGEKDDITGRGQTKAALGLCTSLPDDMKSHYEQPAVGHYGVFNGSRWRAEICPRIADFILTQNTRSEAGQTAVRSRTTNAAARVSSPVASEPAQAEAQPAARKPAARKAPARKPAGARTSRPRKTPASGA
ncbi:polyhydroxyalkanoate depolymerase, intracellular [Hartmannibacter diazotrophicus]|uniref:Polyhydroxyalkanoate depolymerase, intracellular n=1 Tax=Hartmannibacter diazotrophicus TaxID=1482074 RepID=A0A2C9DDW0_9HYPH|nr:polyhydroxyalkanoate depolymerase [Hartmannibacter diazotrophicus]SON58288.1 polyhydroxyalkanoate depolymerase, intracellular [Hartmannibacter diazotrophicus]